MLLEFLTPLSENASSKPGIKEYALYLLSLIMISIAWWFVGMSVFFGNRFSVFSTRAFVKSMILLPGLFLLLVFLAKSFFYPNLKKISEQDRRVLFLTSAAIALLVLILFPLAVPAFQQQHTLQIISTGTKDTESQGTIIEIRKLSYLDGSPMPLQDIELSGDWQIVGGTLISEGDQSDSVAELMGRMPGGVVLNFRHNINAGEVSVIWDGERTDYDLFASQSISTDSVFQGSSRSISQLGRDFLVQLLYFFGLLSIFCLMGLAVDVRWPNSHLVRVLLVLVYVGIFIFFVKGKLSYMEFSAERVFRDTEWYVETASAPLGSLDFLAGIRPFTFPLVLKYFGVTTGNFTDSDLLSDVVQFQYWFSIFAWSALALAISQRMRKLWIRPFIFGLALFFSLNLEIGIWESLVLSESTSFSLFALLIAVWLWWNASSQKTPGHLAQIGYLFLTALITILFVFSRESNQYFVVFGAIIFPIAGFLGKISKGSRAYYLAYLFLFIGIIFLKNASFNISNLWQIHLFDHLAHRILPDQDALDYYVAAGLPLSENLLGIKNMLGYEFHDYLLNDPEMATVREWISTDGMSTYMMYLLSHPIESIIEPFRHLPSIFGGDNLEYHQPLYAVPTIPPWLITLTNRIYIRNLLVIFILFGFAVLGVIRYFFDKNRGQTPWLVVAVFLISLYPMMFIVWHGNPIEIERHAAPIGIQLRLMVWMTVALLLDQLSLGELIPRKMNVDSVSA